MDKKLPISVIVPLSLHRKEFFETMVRPLLEANHPAEILVNDQPGSPSKKRNDYFEKSTQPYISFWDDDCLMQAGYLQRLYEVLRKQPKNIGYAYTGFYGIKLYEPEKRKAKGGKNKDLKDDRGVFTSPTQDFDPEALRGARCGISNMSLIRAECFNGYDESLPKLEDLDMYLEMLSRGIHGIRVPGMFYAFYLDRGLSFSGGNAEAMSVLAKKWGLPDPLARFR